MAHRFTVAIQELGDGRQRHVTRVLAADRASACARALSTLFGQRACWLPDSGLPPRYGQVVEEITRPGETYAAAARTGRVRLDVEEGW